MNFRAKFDAASFILAGEIRNRTNTQRNNQQPIYPHLAYRHDIVWIAQVIKSYQIKHHYVKYIVYSALTRH